MLDSTKLTNFPDHFRKSAGMNSISLMLVLKFPGQFLKKMICTRPISQKNDMHHVLIPFMEAITTTTNSIEQQRSNTGPKS